MARYLSRADLSRIAGKYIDQYYTRFGISKDAPEPIDPERLASAVLGLNVKMLPLCSDGSVLGLTVFQRCGFTVTLGDGTKLVEIFMPKDVVIDSALAADGCTGCRNFTIAHEAAHQILADLFPNDYGKAVKCRGHIAYRERNGQPSWEEWQANTLAAELLMPTFLVNVEIERAALCLPNGILYKSASDPNYEKILEMAARMGGVMVCCQDQTTADAGHKRQSHQLPSIGHHPIWRINMIQSNNRPFKNKPLSNIQQAQFSIGWRFCPVCGHKLYQKDESCSGTIRIKCLKCGNVATVDLAYRRH